MRGEEGRERGDKRRGGVEERGREGRGGWGDLQEGAARRAGQIFIVIAGSIDRQLHAHDQRQAGSPKVKCATPVAKKLRIEIEIEFYLRCSHPA